MDAEKMARAKQLWDWLVYYALDEAQKVSDEDIYQQIAAYLTTAHAAGLERAAEIVDGADGKATPWDMAQAIRREIK